MSEAILVILILLLTLAVFCLYKILDKRGLYFAIVLISIISFVFSFKIGNILKMNINIGIISLCSLFNTLKLFQLQYGKEEQKNLIKVTLYANIITALLLLIMNYYIPAVTETISISIQGTFEYNYKILIVFPIIVAISEFIECKLYNLINEIQNSIIVSGVLSYIITGLIYTVVYSVLAYINILSIKHSLFIGISTYILGFILTIINSIVLNIMKTKRVL